MIPICFWKKSGRGFRREGVGKAHDEWRGRQRFIACCILGPQRPNIIFSRRARVQRKIGRQVELALKRIRAEDCRPSDAGEDRHR